MDDPALLELLGLASSQSDDTDTGQPGLPKEALITTHLASSHGDSDGILFSIPQDVQVAVLEKGRRSPGLCGVEGLGRSTILTQPLEQSGYGQLGESMPTPLNRAQGKGANLVDSVLDCGIATPLYPPLPNNQDPFPQNITYFRQHDGLPATSRYVGGEIVSLSNSPILPAANCLNGEPVPRIPRDVFEDHASAATGQDSREVCHVVFTLLFSDGTRCSVITHKMEEILKHPYMCAICGSVFSSTLTQRNHVIEDHHLVVPGESKETTGTFAEFISDHTMQSVHPGRESREEYGEGRSHPKNRSTENGEENAPTDEKEQYSSRSTNDGFVDQCTKDRTDSEDVPPKTSKTFKCEFCEENFTSNKYRYKHRVAAHADSVFECPGCDKTFEVTAKDKWQHHMRIHKKRSPGPKIDFHTCKVCGMLFKAASSVAIHVQNMHPDHDNDDRPFCCEVCGNMFRTKRSLKSHQRLVHSDDHPFVCSLCNKRFKMRAYLKLHERRHSGDKPYSCQFCEKVFSSAGGCRSHERTHTNERPYKCSFCESTFKTRQQAIVHERTHTKEKPYTCLLCGKSFASRNSFSTHQLLHTGQKPFQCSHCTRSFAQKANMKDHIRSIHRGEKPYHCTACDMKFSRSTSRKLHMEKRHGLKITVKQGRPPALDNEIVSLGSVFDLDSAH